MKRIIFLILLLLTTTLAFAADKTKLSDTAQSNDTDQTQTVELTKPNLIEGKGIYKSHCAVCHMDGIANAPKAHDQQDWEPRMQRALEAVKKQHAILSEEQLKIKAIEYLIHNVKHGLGPMPAHAMCPKCTDQKYLDAIAFMISEKKEKKKKEEKK